MDYSRRHDGLDSVGISRWALCALLLAVVQIAYAIYFFQLPDWTTAWVVTLHSLATAGLYSLVLGVVLVSKSGTWLVGPNGLQLDDNLASGTAALWCVAMICLSSILAFFAGRLSREWWRVETMAQGRIP